MISKRLLLLVFLTALVFVGLVSYGDFRDIGGQLARFPLTHLVAALGLAAINYGLRFLRWYYYLRVLKITVPLGTNILVFLSGLAMSITPGKAGELVKCYLLRDRTGVAVAASVPVVVMERVTDVVSVVLLLLLGLALLPVLFLGPLGVALLPVILLAVLAVVLALCGGFILIMTRVGDRLLNLPLLRRWNRDLHAAHDGMRQLAAPRAVTAALVLGVAAWFSEGLAMWVIMDGLDAHVSVMRSLAIYAAATLVGAVTALPGGLVGTEGSMVALLQQSGIARGAASAGTLLVRLTTLWFAVAVGLVALVCLNRFSRAFTASGEPERPALQSPS